MIRSIKFWTQALKYINIAKIIGSFSSATRRKVGAIIVSPQGKIIGTGFNGAPTGVPNECEQDDVTLAHIIHAEQNAILNATTENLAGSTLYLTDSPCIKCASIIVQKQFKAVIYGNEYHDASGREFCEKYGIPVTSIADLDHAMKSFEMSGDTWHNNAMVSTKKR